MITVSNTTPLRYLIEIEKAHILETLFGHVFIPEKVAEELQRPKTPPEAKQLGLQTVSLFTILERAAARDLIDLPHTIDEMRKTSFRLPPEDEIQAMLERDKKRKKGKAHKKNNK